MHSLYLETIRTKVNGRMGGFYSPPSRIQDAPAITEKLVQRLWFEGAYRPALETFDGKRIQILQTGFWNHQAGPDFLKVTILNENGEKETGDAEVHLSPVDWHRHGHGEDSTYSGTILHIVWKKSPSSFYPKTHDARSIRQIELSSQLRLPLEHLLDIFPPMPDRQYPSAKPGLCHDGFIQWTPKQQLDFLKEAGWHRFQRKRLLWKARVELLGEKQALWLGICEGLGYAGNKAPFRHLAQALPISMLQKESKLSTEALLFGLSGFLPKLTLSRQDIPVATYQRSLWNMWWFRQSEVMEGGIPEKFWKMGNVRPSNHPQRKLGAMSVLASQFNLLYSIIHKGCASEVFQTFRSLRHDFWSFHYTFNSSSRVEVPLVGAARAQAILFNTILPFRSNFGNNDHHWIDSCRAFSSNYISRLVASRLFHGKLPEVCENSFLAQEGLMQIYQDFCAMEQDGCGECTMPHMLERKGRCVPSLW